MIARKFEQKSSPMKATEHYVNHCALNDAESRPRSLSASMQLANHVTAQIAINPGADELEAASKTGRVGHEILSRTTNLCDWRLEQLIDRLPWRLPSTIRSLRHPSAVWIRMPAGVLLASAVFLAFYRSWGSGCFRSA